MKRRGEEMKWTTEKPTKPGWYWFKSTEGTVRIYEIVWLGGEPTAKVGGLSCPFKNLHDRHWAVPIPEPEEA